MPPRRLTPKHASSALFESCRQLIALKLARDREAAALDRERRNSSALLAETEALKARLATDDDDDDDDATRRGRRNAPTVVAPVSPPLDSHTVEEYESKIEFLLRELKQHETTPRGAS